MLLKYVPDNVIVVVGECYPISIYIVRVLNFPYGFHKYLEGTKICELDGEILNCRRGLA